MTESDLTSNVCAECHRFVGQFEEFSERCIKVHTLFNNLISSVDLEIDTVYLQTLRYEAGLDSDEVSALFEKNYNCAFPYRFNVLMSSVFYTFARNQQT